MGGAPSRESTTLYSYFRGTYEIGLIPLTKAFFAVSREENGNADANAKGQDIGVRSDNDNKFSSSRRTSTSSHRASTIELRRQFLHMRSDPVILHANAHRKLTVSWSELLSDTFTEEDLDNYLEKVEKILYDSDAEMIADSQSPLFPVPCALCLVCKEGQERTGSFLWNGRSIVVIGFFGIMNDELCQAFKVQKSTSSILQESLKSNNNINNNNNNNNNNIHPNSYETLLSVCAGVVASAGDRTLERVLVLSAVMLRNQFLNSFYHAHSSAEMTCYGEDNFQNKINGNMGSPFFTIKDGIMSECTMRGGIINNSQIRALGLRSLEQRLGFISVYVETAVDNYSFLKCLTENVAFLQCQTGVDPNMCIMELPQFIIEGWSNTELEMGDADKEKEEEKEKEWKKKNDENKPDTSEIIQEGFKGDTVTMETVKEYRKTDDILPCEGTPPSALSRPQTEEESILQDFDAPVELVRIRFLSKYFVQSTMWASSLLTVPTQLFGSNWVQYKLKDESEKLRHTLHGKDSIVAVWREQCKDIATTYLGKGTVSLLRYVRALQSEVGKARALPLSSWPKEKLIRTREGRTCALHHTSFGTMLVGIRGRNDGETLRNKEVKKNLSDEKVSFTGDSNVLTHSTESVNMRQRSGENSISSTQLQGSAFATTMGGLPVNAIPNMTVPPGGKGTGNISSGGVFNPPSGGFVSPFSFIPNIQPSCNLAMQTNMGPSFMMVPYPTNTINSGAMFVDQKGQPGTGIAPQVYHYFTPSTTPMETGAESMTGTFNTTNNPNVVNGSLPYSQLISSGTNVMQAPPYPFPICNLARPAPSGNSLPSAGNISTQYQPQQPQQQQPQQIMFIQQTASGVPVLIPTPLTRQQPPYGYSYVNSNGGSQILMTSPQMMNRDSSLDSYQFVVGANNGSTPDGTQPLKYVYYVPSPARSC